MKIAQNKQLETDIYDKIRVYLANNKRTGLHVSSLLTPLKAYWEEVAPLPATDDEIGFWLAGLGHHYFLVMAFTGVNDSREASLIDEETGISYSPDLNELNGEFKTSRWEKVPETREEAKKIIDGYRQQCLSYACLKNVNTWQLAVFFLVPRDPDTGRKIPRLKCYTLSFSDKELAKQKALLKERKGLLQEALEKKDPSKLPLCPGYQCMYYKNGQRLVVCKWFETCKPEGRYE